MKTIKRILFLLMVLTTIFSFKIKASHIMGGEVTYKWITGNDYIVRLLLYRDCSGVPAPVDAEIAVFSASCQDSFTVLLPLTQIDQLTTSCGSISSTCNGGTGFGYERAVYSDTVSLPFACSDWQFIWALCCRNGSITNLFSGPGSGAFFYAQLDNLNQPFNNSPVFTADPVAVLSTNITYTINNGAFDPDGDSLVTTLSPALDGNVYNPSAPTLISYNAPFSYLNPVTSSPSLAIDPFTGNITLTPQLTEVDVVVYKVEEYRNGILIGSTTRDIQVIINPGGNQLPVLTGINGTTTFVMNMCYTDTLQFNILSNDPDLGDSTSIYWHVFTGSKNSGSNYSFTASGANPDIATFSFMPDSTQISSQPYYLFVSVKDNACPYYGMQTYNYVIYVNSCSQDVWPGDANSDLQVGLLDLLPIGLAYNQTGPIRSGASLAWVAQPGANWNNSFINGVNHKHADCNGDGTVNAGDTAAISINYGLSHPAKLIPQGTSASTIADLYLEANPDTVSANNIVNVNVCLGTSSVPVDSIYGISFRIHFNSSLVDSTSGTFDFSNSWIGSPGIDMLTMVKTSMTSGFADVAMVRNNQQNTSGDSTIGIFSIVIVDNIAGKTGLPFSLSDVYAITYSEAFLNLNVIGDTVLVNTTTGIANPTNETKRIRIYPVPAGSFIQIDAGTEAINEIVIRDITGRNIQHIHPESLKNMHVDLSKLARGTYMIQVRTDKTISNHRISIAGK